MIGFFSVIYHRVPLSLKCLTYVIVYLQVQRVMSTHNNLSSTLPFIPSSTSILTAHQLSKQHQGSSSGKPGPYPAGRPGTGTLPAGSTRHVTPGAQPWQQPSESLHRKQLIPNTRTLNSVQKDHSKQNVISHQSVQQQQLNRSGGGSGDPRSSGGGGGPVTSSAGSAGSVPLVSVPIRHWWMVSFKLNYIFEN